jgi:hypothetical protein
MTTKSDSVWSKNRRRDGLEVRYDGDRDAWYVIGADGQRLFTRCTCCARPMRSARTAMLVADQTQPVPEEASDD